MTITLDIRHKTSTTRCAWCWEATSEIESHTVIACIRPPYLELHFHHQCWPVYQATSELEVKVKQEWTPERLEQLRIVAGCNQTEMARRLHCNPERLRRFMGGDSTALTPSIVRELKHLSAQVKFAEHSSIDWTDPRAFFCMCRYLDWSILDACRATGSAQSTIKGWQDNGVPRDRPNTWMKLARIAQKHGFDASHIIDDRCWTAELLREAVKASGQPVSIWAALSGRTEHSLRNYMVGKDAITRNGAWHLTQAAVKLGAALPPIGRVPYSRPAQRRHRPSERKKRWTPEMDALLGTMSDTEVARRLGKQPAAVAKHRANLGVPAHRDNGTNSMTPPGEPQ